MTALTGFWRNATPEPPPANAAPAPLRIARGISAFAIIAIFLALHRTDGASACWKKQVKIDDGPERLVPSQGGTNGSNPTCSTRESVANLTPCRAQCEARKLPTVKSAVAEDEQAVVALWQFARRACCTL
jgi:hypothetical protein